MKRIQKKNGSVCLSVFNAERHRKDETTIGLRFTSSRSYKDEIQQYEADEEWKAGSRLHRGFCMPYTCS